MIILFKCNLCDNHIKKYYQNGDIQPNFLTCQCGGVMERQVPDFGMTSMEVVDNGVMARRVELRKDASLKAQEKGDIFIKTMEERNSVLGVKKDESNGNQS